MTFQQRAIEKNNRDFHKRQNEKKVILEKKTDWIKLIKTIFALLEPAIKKTPVYYRLIALAIITFEIWGVVEFVKLVLTIKLF